LADGTFVRISGQGVIFMIEQGRRRTFGDWETFLAWGGEANLSNVEQIPPEDLRRIPVGPAVPKGSKPPAR
jgi:hypothetical protein